jgi:hypothetical protein
MDREALCIIYVPVEDIEVILVKHIQQINDGGHGEEFPASIQHETPVGIEI